MAGEQGPLANEVRDRMRKLAAATGGLYLQTRGVSKLAEVFARIRQHLSQRLYVVYVPTPRGIRNLHKVRVRARPGVPCRVVSGGPARRREEAPSLGESRQIRDAWRLPWPEGWPSEQPMESTLYVLDPPGLLLGRVPDVVQDRGVLFNLATYEDTGALETSYKDRAEIALREIAIDVPGLETVTGSIRGPEEVLLRLLYLSGLSKDQCPAEAAGRDFASFQIISRGTFQLHDKPQGEGRRPLWGNMDEIKEDIGRYAEAGLTELFLEANFSPGLTMEQALEVMDAAAPGGA